MFLSSLRTFSEHLSSHIDLHTHAGSAFDYRVTLTSDLFTSAASAIYCISTKLVTQVVFLLERGHSHTHR